MAFYSHGLYDIGFDINLLLKIFHDSLGWMSFGFGVEVALKVNPRSMIMIQTMTRIIDEAWRKKTKLSGTSSLLLLLFNLVVIIIIIIMIIVNHHLVCMKNQSYHPMT